MNLAQEYWVRFIIIIDLKYRIRLYINLNKLHYEANGQVTQKVSYKIELVSGIILCLEVREYLIVGF